MTNKFFDYIQPTIIKTSNHPELPEYLRNRYLINFNILGIRYFDQYYLLKESNDGIPYLIMKEDKYYEYVLIGNRNIEIITNDIIKQIEDKTNNANDQKLSILNDVIELLKNID